MSTALEPRHVHPLRWRQAIDVARDTCGRFFAAGRSPDDAVHAFGLSTSGAVTWAHAIKLIAELHCATVEHKQVA
jgi:hypothetical protein